MEWDGSAIREGRGRRIWSETVPAETLRGARVRALLRRFGLGVVVAARPGELDALPRTVDALAGEGIAVGVWPMLDDADGRWASARNAARFAAFAREVARLVRVVRPGIELVVDLEPPIDEVRAAMRADARGLRALGRALVAAEAPAMSAAREVLGELVRELAARGIGTSAVAAPMVLFDRRGAPRWEAILGTPLEGPPWARVNVMLYTSMIEGWARGLLDRAGAQAILAAGCRATVARFGARGGVSLGAVGVGALGDEIVYRAPAELARDVAIARACGVEDLTLFELGGVLRREPAEAWLEALVETAPLDGAIVEPLRAHVVLAAARALGRASGIIAPLSEIARRARGVRAWAPAVPKRRRRRP